MDALIALLILSVFVLPVLAIILIIVLFNRQKMQANALASLRDLLGAVQKHVAALEKRVGSMEGPVEAAAAGTVG